MDLSAWWPYIEQTAADRLEHNRTVRHVSDYGPEIETLGAAGELAARCFLQLPMQLHTQFDGGADLYYRGLRVDVKTTLWTSRLRKRFMQWPEWKRIKADLVFMAAVDMRRKKALAVGFALPEDIQQAPINRERAYPCYEIPVMSLRSAVNLLLLEDKDAFCETYYPSAQAEPPHGLGYHLTGAGA